METLDDQILGELEPETIDRPLALVAIAALAAGSAELALHSWLVSGEPPGIGIALAVAAIVAGLIRGTVPLHRSPDSATAAAYVAAIGFAALSAIRDSTPLVAINLIASVFLIGLATTMHNPATRRPVFIADFARVVVRSMSNSWFGALLVAARDLPECELPSTERLRRMVLGALMALPLLIVFGVLFMSADAVFNEAVGDVFRFQLPSGVVSAIAIAAMLGWLILGLLRGIVVTPSANPDRSHRSFVGSIEASTTMWLLNGLFAVFVSFQVFEAIVSYQAADVSYAHQARSGFFQLVWVAAIVVVVVLVLDWAVHPQNHSRLHRQELVLIALTGAILVSAVVRMALYVEAYGLTRLRVFTTVFMLWIAFVLVWSTRSVLRGRRHRFAIPVVTGLLAAVLVLNIINPDGLIASYNLEHIPHQAAEVDRTYLYSSLSSDAVPVIVDNLAVFGDPCDQLAVLNRLPAASSSDLRSWNLSRSTAESRVSAVQQELEPSCQSG